jgi:hypothetical protein
MCVEGPTCTRAQFVVLTEILAGMRQKENNSSRDEHSAPCSVIYVGLVQSPVRPDHGI